MPSPPPITDAPPRSNPRLPLRRTAGSPWVLPAAVLLAAVIAVPVWAAAGAGSLAPSAAAPAGVATWTPPFSSFGATVSNSTGVSACGSNAHVGVPPTFTASSGAFSAALGASAGPGPGCGRHWVGGDAGIQLLLLSPTFSVGANGVHSVYLRWALDYALNYSVTNYGSAASEVQIGVYFTVSLVDQTEGYQWLSPLSLDNITSSPNGNASSSALVRENLTFPVLASLVAGDSYQVEAAITGFVDAQEVAGGVASAHLVVGSSAGFDGLRSVTVS